MYQEFNCLCVLQEAKETKVAEAKFFTSASGTGVGILTAANRIFVVNNICEPKVRQVPEVPSKFYYCLHQLIKYN